MFESLKKGDTSGQSVDYTQAKKFLFNLKGKMLELLKIETASIFGYFYIPERKAPGLITIDRCTGDVQVEIEAPYDVEAPYPYFAKKAKGIVMGFVENNEFPENKVFTWF